MTDENIPDLPVYSLFIHQSNVRKLHSDIWNDTPVPAKLAIGKKQQQIGVAFRGNHIRELKKKSYIITFRNQKNSPTELHLNAEFLDPSLIRSKLSFDFFQMMNLPAPSCKHIFLKINGSPAGIYLEIESVDQRFFRKKNLPIKAIYYAIHDDANFSLFSRSDMGFKADLLSGYEAIAGTRNEHRYLSEMILKINALSNEEFPDEIAKYLDVDQFLRWLAGVVCIQNFDAFQQNYSLALNARTNRFLILPWDNEGTWGRDCYGDLMDYNYVPITGDSSNLLIVRLLEHAPFRRKYKAILEEILTTTFTEETLAPKIASLNKALLPYLAKDPFLEMKQIDEFENELEYILQYIRDRNRYLREHLVDLN
jgi:spore coat protein H